MIPRRDLIRIGGAALFAGLSGCVSGERSSDPSDTASPSETTNERTETSTEPQSTAEPTSTETSVDLGFPVADLTTAEVRRWDEIGEAYDGARVITSNAIYANAGRNIGKIPHGTGEVAWAIERNGSDVVPYQNDASVATDAGVYDGSSGEQLFSVGDRLYSPTIVSDGVWYFNNDGQARKFDFDGQPTRTIFTTVYDNYSGGTIDEAQGVLYVASLGGLFGVDIDASSPQRAETKVEIGTGSDIDMVSDDLDGGRFALTGDSGVYVTSGTAVSFDRTEYSRLSRFSISTKSRYTTATDGKLVARNSPSEGQFECFDLRTGERLWSTGTLPLENASQRKPVVFNGYLVVKLQGRRLGVYQLDSGDRVTTVDLSAAPDDSLRGRMDKLHVDTQQLVIANLSGFKRLTGTTEIVTEN